RRERSRSSRAARVTAPSSASRAARSGTGRSPPEMDTEVVPEPLEDRAYRTLDPLVGQGAFGIAEAQAEGDRTVPLRHAGSLVEVEHTHVFEERPRMGANHFLDPGRRYHAGHDER